ncbi:AAA family ATPase [Pseudoalteromonas peptidolytica]|uniref:MoxR-like ATPase n=1 Tax=Pseudoalteromonas peptidolytica F12-50-A1 TaxID=1315280 RepID=A0A8I0MVS9_9GAMM|nr:MoxR family ATPase [Pseudoalteromonas peptidolytica]MBE0346403.1 MoxR-like ATPase [Pseudoalteromonas peptidolytica F12-50-A1]NLR14652.1 MoxR family ATPase [Pseudoalteromonas peptidolytica]GEK08963.1 ATPase AAA [Pseudoalteromonas peptidolytica]
MNQVINDVIDSLSAVILEKPEQIKLAICSLLCRGHLLIEDLPGMGKTTLSHSLADVLGLNYRRVQFTSDLLPSDITGTSIFNREQQSFEFHPGPVFTQVLLADEINRASPKTQSALLESMEEHQVTIDGESHKLPSPFFVIATQNPQHQSGTYPLPESQLDRFFMRISLGYPSEAAEAQLIHQAGIPRASVKTQQVIDSDALLKFQQKIPLITLSDAVVSYILRLITYTRSSGMFSDPLSPRASIALASASRAYAFINGRDFVIPDDVQAVFTSVCAHRLGVTSTNEAQLKLQIFDNVPVH